MPVAFRFTLPFSEIREAPLWFAVSPCSSTLASFSILLYRTEEATVTLDAVSASCSLAHPCKEWCRLSMWAFASRVTSPPGTSLPPASFLTASPVAFRVTPGATVTAALLTLSTTATAAPAVI